MNKVFDNINSYSPIKIDYHRTIVSYGLEDLGNGNATWYEIYFTHQHGIYPSFEQIKNAIITDINARTDQKILSGFVWNGKNIWLSEENQKNFSEAQRIALMSNGGNLPIAFKLGEDEEGNPVYYEFTTVEELTQFYLSAVAYIQQCLTEGWNKKDNINWESYKVNEQ